MKALRRRSMRWLGRCKRQCSVQRQLVDLDQTIAGPLHHEACPTLVTFMPIAWAMLK